MVKEVLETLKAQRPTLAPSYVWRAYERLERANGPQPQERGHRPGSATAT